VGGAEVQPATSASASSGARICLIEGRYAVGVFLACWPEPPITLQNRWGTSRQA
jgi:hypothetical protein